MDSPLLYIMAVIIILGVLVQSILFLRKALKRAKEIGMDREVVKKTVRSSALFSIVPSIPIAIGMAAMVPLLGVALPWIRLSVIGAVQYEVYAATTSASVMGISDIATGLSAGQFNTIAWVMTLSILGGTLACIFFLKTYENKLERIKHKDEKWADILVGAIFMGLVGTIGAQQIAKGGAYIYTLLISMAIMIVLALFIKKLHWKWLESWALPISMAGALACSFLFV